MTHPPVDRLRLWALRYAVNDEAEQYIAIMRLFTDGTAGLLSDLSAREARGLHSDGMPMPPSPPPADGDRSR